MTHRSSRLMGALFAALLGLVLFARPAYAAEPPQIAYDGTAQRLTVTDANNNTQNPNLFTQFSGVIPGDVLTQEIKVSFSGVTGQTRLYIKALTHGSQLTDDAQKALGQMTLAVSFDDVTGGAVTVAPDAASPQQVFAGADADDYVLVATVSGNASLTMKLVLTVPTSVGNEMNDLADVTIPWSIKVEDDGHGGGGSGGDEPGGDTTAAELHAADLTAYEGGLGSSSTQGRVDNLPEPEWNIAWDEAEVVVDGDAWDVEERGLPFTWHYVNVETGEPVVSEGALAGLYRLMVEPLDGSTVTVDGKPLDLPDDGVATLPDGSDVITQVRDVTNDDAADALDPSYFKDVFGGRTRSLANLFGLLADSAVDGDFTASGTHTGDCDNSVAHAHVAAGTTFVKNGDANKPVNDGARVGLLWDELLSSVLGQTEHMDALDAKARAVIGWTDEKDVQSRFRYLDLVDMNDGNVWVATADGSDTTVFVPYPDGVSPEDDVAIVRFDGLTRDYTVGMGGTDLDSAVAASTAHAVAVTKTSDGLLFDVPCAEFGPFELLWKPASGEGGEEPGPDEPGGEEPGPDEPGGDEPGGEEPGPGGEEPGPGGDEPGGTDEPGGPAGGEDQTDRPHDEVIAGTGDALPTFMPLLALGGAALIAIALLVRRRSRTRAR